MPAGGATLSFTYNQRRTAWSTDYLDMYILTPGITWDPGDVWTEDGSIRCQREDFPAGVILEIQGFGYVRTAGESADYGYERKLDDWKAQRIRVVFRQYWEYGALHDSQTRIRNLLVRAGFTVNPDRLYLSTGDTKRTITTDATPPTTSFTPTLIVENVENPDTNNDNTPDSSCDATLSFSNSSGTGSVTNTVTAAPAGCGGTFTVRSGEAPAWSSNSTLVVVPPQLMIKAVAGEAGGQPSDLDQQVLLVVARNRFGDPDFQNGKTTWQGQLVPREFYGIPYGPEDGPDRPLRNSGLVFLGEIGDVVGGSKCYWSPKTAEWQRIEAALVSQTTSFPTEAGAPRCWVNMPVSRQIVVKTSLGENVSGGSAYRGAPVFVFMRLRQATDPAVVQIP